MRGVWIGMALAAWLLAPQAAQAHCDTMDGPVVKAARQAIEKGNVTPVLKWVKPENEAAVRASFRQARAACAKGAAARKQADRRFFETVVRLHRAGEGEPFTGLKPAGTDPGPAVRAADRALETGSSAGLLKLFQGDAAREVHTRFAETLARKRFADRSVADGRRYVAAYVGFVHYAEEAYHGRTGGEGHAHEDASSGEHGEHRH